MFELLSPAWETTNHKDELKLVEKDPLDGVAILFILGFCSFALDKGVTDQGVDRGLTRGGKLGRIGSK
jgi:hypothetical protein